MQKSQNFTEHFMSDLRIDSESMTGVGSITPSSTCVIRVLGIGGGGGNTIQHLHLRFRLALS